jgi:hypothetical protein
VKKKCAPKPSGSVARSSEWDENCTDADYMAGHAQASPHPCFIPDTSMIAVVGVNETGLSCKRIHRNHAEALRRAKKFRLAWRPLPAVSCRLF